MMMIFLKLFLFNVLLLPVLYIWLVRWIERNLSE